jgi:CBS domain containing-hemolysin-like protein
VTPALGLALVVALILLEGFFSGSELALVSVDRVRIRASSHGASRSMRLLGQFLAEPERILTTTLIGTNACVVATTTVFALLAEQWLSDNGHSPERADLLTVLCLTPVMMLFGELLPKSLARRHSARLAPLVVHPLHWLATLLFPVVTVVRGITRAALAAAGSSHDAHLAVSRDELRLLLEKGRLAEIEQTERQIIQRVFEFPEITVRETTRPLIDVTAVEESEPLKEAIRLFQETGYSRLPIYHERVDDIVGVLHALDVLEVADPERPCASLKRPVSYVPASQKAEQLLEDLQRRRQGIAVVVDEYGGAQGIVTVEDILEEIVGEIEDEHDEPNPDIRRRGEREWIVSARVEVDRLNDAIGVGIPEGDYETLAGFLLDSFGRIPKPGDKMETERAELTVIGATSRVIEEVQVKRKPEEGGEAGEGGERLESGEQAAPSAGAAAGETGAKEPTKGS